MILRSAPRPDLTPRCFDAGRDKLAGKIVAASRLRDRGFGMMAS
jgi:hypothetical protein